MNNYDNSTITIVIMSMIIIIITEAGAASLRVLLAARSRCVRGPRRVGPLVRGPRRAGCGPRCRCCFLGPACPRSSGASR